MVAMKWKHKPAPQTMPVEKLNQWVQLGFLPVHLESHHPDEFDFDFCLRLDEWNLIGNGVFSIGKSWRYHHSEEDLRKIQERYSGVQVNPNFYGTININETT